MLVHGAVSMLSSPAGYKAIVRHSSLNSELKSAATRDDFNLEGLPHMVAEVCGFAGWMKLLRLIVDMWRNGMHFPLSLSLSSS